MRPTAEPMINPEIFFDIKKPRAANVFEPPAPAPAPPPMPVRSWASIRDGVLHDLLLHVPHGHPAKKFSRRWDAALKPALVGHNAIRHAQLMQQIAELGLVVTEVARDASSVAYWQQGDLELNTEQVMRLRMSLRTHPRILSVLLAWWETALRCDGHTDPEGRGHISKSAYEQVVLRLHVSLIPGFDPTSPESRDEIEGEWRNDANGKDVMCRDDFYDALFELAECAAVTRARARLVCAAD